MWRLWQLFTMAPWHFLNKIFDCLQTTKTVKLKRGIFGRALVECDPRLKTHCVKSRVFQFSYLIIYVRHVTPRRRYLLDMYFFFTL